jgi:hypothetical protein
MAEAPSRARLEELLGNGVWDVIWDHSAVAAGAAHPLAGSRTVELPSGC